MASESEFDQIKRLKAEITAAQSKLKTQPGLDAEQKDELSTADERVIDLRVRPQAGFNT